VYKNLVISTELRREISRRMPNVRCSFEPGDIISEVMSFGSPTPVEVSVSGPNVAESRVFVERLRDELRGIPELRDLQLSKSLDYPTLAVRVDREKAGLSGVTSAEIARSLVAATSSSRFVVPNYWPDPKTGIGYQVQVQIPQGVMRNIEDLQTVPIKESDQGRQLLLRDVADVQAGSMPGQFDRYNMKREISLTANLTGTDLGSVARDVDEAIRRAGTPPTGANLEVRGLIPSMRQMLSGLSVGLALAVVVIFLLLAANFQSWRLAFVTISTAPAAISGVVLALWITRTTVNIQSFIGAIMAIGVSMANAILLVTFAEQRRRAGEGVDECAIGAALSRLRPILMTSLAMTAGMLPLALAWGESGEQVAPLGRAVIGGLIAATLCTLLVLPAVFAALQARASCDSSSLDPLDPQSRFFRVGAEELTT
jgi:multidrug efflux pump subunit AcrB